MGQVEIETEKVKDGYNDRDRQTDELRVRGDTQRQRKRLYVY